MTRDSLVAAALLYHPANLDYTDEGYGRSIERVRAAQAWDRAAQHAVKWEHLLDLVRNGVTQREMVGDLTVPFRHGALRVAIYARGTPFVVVGAVSIYAPIYFVYGVRKMLVPPHEHEPLLEALPEVLQTRAELLSKSIEKTYSCSLLSRDLAQTVIPDITVEPKRLGSTTIMDALIASELEHVF